uniref:Reverse transcriptase domain-containing protein n=1 Tax=Fagus sylvatica TaxID=28930 RepID=A0A2N9GVB7_FAGSY
MKSSQRCPTPGTIWPLPARRRVMNPPRVPGSDDLQKATWMTERHKTPFSLRTQAGPKPVPLRSPHSFLQVFRSVARPDCRPLVSLKHQLAPSVGNAHICLSPHRYKRTAWSGRDRWKYTLKRFPPVASLLRWLRWRNKYEISLQTFRNSLDRTRTTEQQQEQQQNNNTSNAKNKRVRRRAKTRGITAEESSAKWEQEVKAMRIQMGEMKDEFKGRTAKNLDDLVHTTDSPFTKAESFKTVMCLQGVPDEIMCRAFPTTLKGPARVWFKKITPGSKDRETLRSYLTRFNKETLLVDGADDKVVLTAFISGLQAGDFLFSVYKDPPSTMTEMMYEAQRHMNGEEALLARDQTIGKKRKWEHPDRPAESHETRPKAQRNRNRRQEDRSGRGFNERFNHFTPLNAPVDHIFMQIRNDPALKWPGKLLTDPDKRPRDKYCRFHRDHGHNTEDCYDLKRQIEELIKQGKLQRFVERGQREGRPQGIRQQRPPVEALPRPPPLGEIHVITGGVAAGGTSRSSRKAYARQIHNVLVTQKMDKKPRLEDLPVTFTEEDARKVFHPHDDALVVTLEIAGYSTRRVLIDNGSSADIIYLTAFQQMRIDKNQLRPIETPLVGFTGTSVYPLGIITLQLIADRISRRSSQNIAEPTEELEEIVLVEGLPNEKRTTRIGTSMTEGVRDSIVRFLRENADIFAWSHADMPGISTKVVAHQLNVNPSIHPVKQKRRVFAPERNAAIMEEVDKLLKAGFIREVYYLEWLANVDSYPLPRIDQLVDSTAGHKLLSFMDAFSGYNQIQMAEEDQEKTAFITSRGLFCYKVMPFGLKNAGATYQRLVNKMFHDQIGRNVEVYVDDMLVKSKKDDNHLADLKETFQALRRYNMKLNPAKCVFGVSSGKFLGFMVSQRGIEANPDKIKAILEMSPPKTVKEVQSLTGKAAALNRFVSRSTDKCLPFFKILRKAFHWTEECQQAFEELKVYLTSPPLLSPSQTGEALYLYLAVSASAVSSALIREEERVQKPVYYTSRALRGRSMNKPDAAGRLIQWSIEMSEFDIDYRPRTAIKAQALADFIAEFTHPLKEDEQSEEGKAWTMNIDGSSTKEMSGAGVVLVSPEKDKFEAKYGAKEDRMKKYLAVVMDLLTHFEKVELLQIPRKDNVAADHLARLASSGIEIDGFMEIQGRPSTEEEETVNSITTVTTWMSPLIRYLREGTLPANRAEAHKLRIRASHFRLMGGILRWAFHGPTLDVCHPKKQTMSSEKSMMGSVETIQGQDLWRTSSQEPAITGRPFYMTPPNMLKPATSIHKRMVKSKLQTEPYSSRLRPGLKGQRVCGWKSFQACCGHTEPPSEPQQKKLPSSSPSAQKAVIPVEIGLTTFRTTFHKEEENEGQLRLNLDLLDETREKAAQRIALYQGRMARYYNTKAPTGKALTRSPNITEGAPIIWKTVMERSYLILGTLNTSRSTTLETVKTGPAFVVEDRQESSSVFYHVRHPRGAYIEEDLQVGSSVFYHVRHPRGAYIEEDFQAGSSVFYHVRHPRGAYIEEDLQAGSSVFYHVRHPRGAYIEEDLQAGSSVFYHVRHPRGAYIEEDLQAGSPVFHHVRHLKGAFIEEDLQESSSVFHHVRHPRGASIEEDLH